MKRLRLLLVAVAFLGITVSAVPVLAANTPDLTQQINAGSLATDILDSSRVAVASPSAALSTQSFSFNCLSGGSASTGNLGTNTQRVYVINPDAADNGWTLTIAATSGNTARWQNGGVTQFFDFNDPGGSGCTDGADGDAQGGQLTVNPSVGTITTDCLACVGTNVTLGSSGSFSQGVTDSVTLINAAAGSDDIWRGYLTNAALSQTIPAEQAVDSYTLNMTVTVTAL
jgi:hypothetical protein